MLYYLTRMSVLKLSDAFCYICRGVLIEPVTVPCLHVFCFTCFEQSMQETSYSCPLCRRRISNWVRTAKKTSKLINIELWMKIKEQFKDQVNCKLRGEDDGLDEKIKQECSSVIHVSQPGEIGKEFSELMNDLKAEREKLRIAEELASKALISKLAEEEEIRIRTEKRDNALKIEKDEELARQLQEEINKEVPTSSGNNLSSELKKQKNSTGPMDIFLKGNLDINVKKKRIRVQDILNNRSTSSDSTDSIQSEMHHFKPIKVVPRTPPKRYPDGQVLEIPVTKVKPLRLINSQKGINSCETKNTITESKKIHSPYSAFIGKVGMGQEESPRKRLRSDEPGGGVLKEITLEENSDSNSMGSLDTDDKKKKRNSPVTVSKGSHLLIKSVQSNFLVSPKLVHLNTVKNNQKIEEENENNDVPQEFDTQNYLDPEPDIEAELIEEQRRIEKLILQEKADRELALKLSQEWEERYELRNKPKHKQIILKKKAKGHENKKLQQTLIANLINKRSKKK